MITENGITPVRRMSLVQYNSGRKYTHIAIDCQNRVLGSTCALISKLTSSNLNLKVDVINLDKLSVKTGLAHFQNKMHARWSAGCSVKGPFRARSSEAAFLKAMKGMLNMNRTHGVSAFKRIRIADELSSRAQVIVFESEKLIGHNIHNFCKIICSL